MPKNCRLCEIILSHATPQQAPAVKRPDMCQWCYDHYGHTYHPPRVDHAQNRQLQLDSVRLEILEALALLSGGATVADIARDFGIRQNTVCKRLVVVAPNLFGFEVVQKRAKVERVTPQALELLKENGYV